MKNLLKLGQGPRPDLLFEEEEKAKKSDTQPDGQKQKIEFEKGLRTVRKEAKKKAREEKKKQEPIEMSRKDKLAVILAFCELLLPLAIGVMAIFAFLIWFLGKFWQMEKENTRGDRHFRGRCFLFYTKSCSRSAWK